jgi:hypothetical protein
MAKFKSHEANMGSFVNISKERERQSEVAGENFQTLKTEIDQKIGDKELSGPMIQKIVDDFVEWHNSLNFQSGKGVCESSDGERQLLRAEFKKSPFTGEDIKDEEREAAINEAMAFYNVIKEGIDDNKHGLYEISTLPQRQENDRQQRIEKLEQLAKQSEELDQQKIREVQERLDKIA